MKPLKKYVVSLEVYVLGEDQTDALDYVNAALGLSDFLEQDGIFGVNAVSEQEDVDEYEG